MSKLEKPKASATKAQINEYLTSVEHELENTKNLLTKADKRIVDKDAYITQLKNDIILLKSEISGMTNENSQLKSLNRTMTQDQNLQKNKLNKIPSWVRRIYGAN
jgi:archaellum component FlaC